MRKLKEDVKQEEERILFLDKFEKNEITEEETEAELQRLQAEVERRGSNASQGQLPHGSGGRHSWAVWDWKKRCLLSSFCAGCSSRANATKRRRAQESSDRAGAVEPLQRLLVLILLGFQMQEVKAEPQETLKKIPGFRKSSLSETPGGSRKPMEDDSNLQKQAKRRKEKQPGWGPQCS